MDKYNAEGYYDPTAYEALSRIEREERKAAYRPLVYICSPYSGNVDFNVTNARIYCKYAVDNKCILCTAKINADLRSKAFALAKVLTIAPHLLFPQFMNDEEPTDRELAMFMNMVLLSKCEELWVFGNTISQGMGQEIAKAEKRRMKIRYFDYELKEVGGF